jgi:A/G-specific adenine glycosylase
MQYMNTLFDIDFNEQHNALLSAFWKYSDTNNKATHSMVLRTGCYEGQAETKSTKRAARNNQSEQLIPAIHHFKAIINHYHEYKRRSFSWRDHVTPYRVVVSEVMLQQTQTDRVAPKFEAFVEAFPDFASLANAPFHEVLRLWKGLGYNRRAMALQKIATLITTQHAGILPDDPTILETFPGIGKATARSIVAFAYNKPTVFIETNIRTVFIYFFFKDQTSVTDKELEPLIKASVSTEQPREWYYALMDYGVMLKKVVGNVSKLSAHYTKQSKFEGSDRQLRGKILQLLLDQPGAPLSSMVNSLDNNPQRVHKLVDQLCGEGFIKNVNGLLWLKS